MRSQISTEADASQLVSPSNVRQLGSYYTPQATARALVSWAVRTGNESIIEPSAGGGALISAAFQRAASLGVESTMKITAFDVDLVAIEKLRSLNFEALEINHKDFLEQSTLVKNFDVVLANPPFNRNHSLTEEQRKSLRNLSRAPGAIGLWGHFLLHAIKFLRKGGRVASIVPRSVIFTVHGDKFLQNLCKHFSSVGIYELTTRPEWSNAADEAGAVILADGFNEGSCCQYARGYIDDEGSIRTKTSEESPYASILRKHCIELGEIAALSIGAVTGRNSVFLLTDEERAGAKFSPNDVLPVVSRSKQLKGIALSVQELREMGENGHKTWLLAPKSDSAALQNYLKIIPDADRESVNWFRKRTPWWKVQVPQGHHAIFTYMNDLGPRLVKVAEGIACTNTLHRITFKDNATTEDMLSAFLTPISTFAQLFAEGIGRSYGGGVLKFELAEARRIPVFSGPGLTQDLFERVDDLLKSGQHIVATDEVDKAIMQPLFGSMWKVAQVQLQEELAAQRKMRRGIKAKKGL